MTSNEERFYAIVKTFVNGIVFLTANLSETLERLALSRVKARGNFDLHVGENIAFGETLQDWHSEASDTKSGPALCAGWNFQIHGAVERWHSDFSTKRGCGEGNRHFAGKIIAVARKNFVFLDVDDHVEIPRGPAAKSRFAAARAAQARITVNTSGDFDFDPAGLLDAPFALAGCAGLLDDTTRSVAGGAGLCDLKKSSRGDDLPASAAGRACDRLATFLCPRAAAGFAGVHFANLDFLFTALRSLL